MTAGAAGGDGPESVVATALRRAGSTESSSGGGPLVLPPPTATATAANAGTHPAAPPPAAPVASPFAAAAASGPPVTARAAAASSAAAGATAAAAAATKPPLPPPSRLGSGDAGNNANTNNNTNDVGWRSARHVWGDIQRAAERRQEEEAALLAARPKPPLSSRAKAAARDATQRLRGSLASTSAVVRARPSVALWSLLTLFSLLAAGLWAVLATAATAERRARDDALFRAEQVLQNLLFRVQTAVFPNTAVSMFVYKAAARGADAAGAAAIAAAGGIVPSLLRGTVPPLPPPINSTAASAAGRVTSAEAMAPNANFYDISSVIRATVPAAGVVLSIMAAPGCVVTSADPLEPNKGAMGLNLLCDERCSQQWPGLYNGTRYKNRRAETMLTLRRAPEQTLAGPYALTQGGWGAIARLP
jgi:hypothetical protein